MAQFNTKFQTAISRNRKNNFKIKGSTIPKNIYVKVCLFLFNAIKSVLCDHIILIYFSSVKMIKIQYLVYQIVGS